MAQALKTYTVWTRDVEGVHGSTHICAVHARDWDEAKEMAANQCAADWECSTRTLDTYGLALGDVHILEWTDPSDKHNA